VVKARHKGKHDRDHDYHGHHTAPLQVATTLLGTAQLSHPGLAGSLVTGALLGGHGGSM
jgi:hypothetical protein